ncbi:tRNA dimethylallyltransferase [Coccinella septempunctata]|uniref:tRNA dimethylallyltransferase n=1 Tax=Coccinella septempunctata TaxID=41139 RepID=UPI001D089944|nr:tRNA dimethylallyltransferase [Coccinella septempunctata]
MGSKLPLVVILGATGSGKTKLSLEIAQKFGGEIISADSMQIYKGLDIITAKVTKEEQLLAPHHLIDILEPEETFTVIEYRNRAKAIIDKLFSCNKVPIVVGGTNYYIESLLWNILVDDCGQNLKRKSSEIFSKEYDLSSRELHNQLKQLDPEMAKRLHPNNRRKILRSLEVLYDKGRKLSDILNEQHSSEGGSKTSGGLRYPNSLILWLQCEQKVLNTRLDNRVDEMVNEGLVDELLRFHRHFQNPDYTKGMFQSIGFKEFNSYLKLEEAQRSEEIGKKKLEEGIELLKLVTRRYAKKQIKWINNRFLGRTDRAVPPIYGLDTTNVSEWIENVSTKASRIIDSYIEGSPCPYPALPKLETVSSPNVDDDTYNCEICDRIFIGQLQWNLHLKSNKHKKIKEKQKKMKNNEILHETILTQATAESHLQQREIEKLRKASDNR